MGDFRDDGGRSREDREIEGLQSRLESLRGSEDAAWRRVRYAESKLKAVEERAGKLEEEAAYLKDQANNLFRENEGFRKRFGDEEKSSDAGWGRVAVLEAANTALTDKCHGLLNRLEVAREKVEGYEKAFLEKDRLIKGLNESYNAICTNHDAARAELRDCDGERIRLLAEIGGYMRANAELERRVIDRDDLVHSLRTMVELGSAMIDAQENTIDMLKEALQDLRRGATGESLTNLSESLARLGAVVGTLPTAIDGLAAMRQSS